MSLLTSAKESRVYQEALRHYANPLSKDNLKEKNASIVLRRQRHKFFGEDPINKYKFYNFYENP